MNLPSDVSFAKHSLSLFFRNIFGPFPYFTLERHVSSNINNKPEESIIVWTSPSRFTFKCLAIVSTVEEAMDVVDEWRTYYERR